MHGIWKLKPPSPQTSKLSLETGLSLLQSQILINRGIADASSAISFITPRLSDLLDPILLKDMSEAVDLIIKVIEKGERIVIYGDFDADGITSTALLLNFFSSLDASVSYYIPHRLTEGYGLNREAIDKIADRGASLIITVDCGVANMKEASQALDRGIKVVVTDHHQIPDDFRPICPVINPHRPDSRFPFNELAGVGVAFFLAIALRATLRDRGWFKGRDEPDLKHYLDLVALGTVADMVPLTGQNRILVKSGLDIMRITRWPGLKALRGVAGIMGNYISPYDLSFKIVPRLNASGRVGDPATGVKALTTIAMEEARSLALLLNDFNRQRQAIEGEIFNEIEESLFLRKEPDHRRTFVFTGTGWHRGVLGIVASKLMDKYCRPVLVLGVENGIAIGSGRSIEGFNLFRALTRLSPFLEKFGGHYHAAGLTLKSSNIDRFTQRLEEMARKELKEKDLVPTITIDAQIRFEDVSLDMIRSMEDLSPFGIKNPEPVFYAENIQVISSKIVGERHLKLKVKEGKEVLEAIGFGLSDYHSLKDRKINAVFTPEINRFRGNARIQLRIIDLEEAGTSNTKLLKPGSSD